MKEDRIPMKIKRVEKEVEEIFLAAA